jgi:MoaA/NifB/PqqE/SkfB family radical SAM enzyme
MAVPFAPPPEERRMVIRKLPLGQKLLGSAKYVRNRIRRRPLLVSIEMTRHCNAGCDFCDDWRTRYSPRLGDVVAMVQQLQPVVVALTGGEPLVEKNLPALVRAIKASQRFVYVYIVTNGSLLTAARAAALFEAGLDQLSISMNYLDERHDLERKLPGLHTHLATLVPQLAARGYTVVLNTVIMQDNLDQILPIARAAHGWGALVSYSCYSPFKNGNRAHAVTPGERHALQQVVDGLRAHQRACGNITNSRYYLGRIPAYFAAPEGLPGCRAGNDFLQLTPDGRVRQCAEFSPFVDYRDWRGMAPTRCSRCWNACRGESEASLTLARVGELLRRT